MDRLLVLRSQKRFSEAAVLLRDTLATKGSVARGERISYGRAGARRRRRAELPTWRKHVASFGDSRSKRRSTPT